MQSRHVPPTTKALRSKPAEMLATFFWWLIKADSRPLLILSDKVWDLRLSESFNFALHSSCCFVAVLRNDLQHVESQL